VPTAAGKRVRSKPPPSEGSTRRQRARGCEAGPSTAPDAAETGEPASGAGPSRKESATAAGDPGPSRNRYLSTLSPSRRSGERETDMAGDAPASNSGEQQVRSRGFAAVDQSRSHSLGNSSCNVLFGVVPVLTILCAAMAQLHDGLEAGSAGAADCVVVGHHCDRSTSTRVRTALCISSNVLLEFRWV
jgi:hypothetical protein